MTDVPVAASRDELLFVSPRFLFPADSGGKIRTTQILKGLKGGRFRIRLLAPSTPAVVEQHAADLCSVCDAFETWSDVSGTLSHRLWRLISVLAFEPVSVASDRSDCGRSAVARALARRPAVVVFDFPHSAVLAPPGFESVPSALFTHNVESWIFERHASVATGAAARLLWRSQWRKMVRFEREALARFDTVIAVSEKDAAWFRDTWSLPRVDVIPTGVDPDYFTWQAPPAGVQQVVFIGSMDWHANQDGMRFFMDEVWPAVANEVPGATMKVIGRRPPASLVARAPRGWTFTGFVNDVRPEAASSAVSVIPLRVGGGTRIKAYEAMAMGLPVVSTTIGVEGLPLTPNLHYLRADDAPAFARAVVRLLHEASLRERLSREARTLVESRYANRQVAQVFERICADTVSRAAVRRGQF